jgi:hypothetical protein
MYYVNRKYQHEYEWDKGADLRRIDDACTKEGWSFEACAGTFWFSRDRVSGTDVITVTERTLPDGGISNVVAPGEPFGAFAEITSALNEKGMTPLFINANSINAGKTEPEPVVSEPDEPGLDPDELEIV